MVFFDSTGVVAGLTEPSATMLYHPVVLEHALCQYLSSAGKSHTEPDVLPPVPVT